MPAPHLLAQAAADFGVMLGNALRDAIDHFLDMEALALRADGPAALKQLGSTPQRAQTRSDRDRRATAPNGRLDANRRSPIATVCRNFRSPEYP